MRSGPKPATAQRRRDQQLHHRHRSRSARQSPQRVAGCPSVSGDNESWALTTITIAPWIGRLSGALRSKTSPWRRWSVENFNHWKRDSTNWKKDRETKRKPKGAKNLALSRNAPLAVIPFERFGSLNDAFDRDQDHRNQPFKIIESASSCKE